MHIHSSRLALLTLLAISTAAVVHGDPAPPGPAPFDPGRFVPVDTRSLLGSPDPLPPLEVVRAFPRLEFVRPVAVTNARDGSNRVFVCDQIGAIWVFPDDESVEVATEFLDIREKTRTVHFEEGLLGLAFHPRYRQNGELFIYYSTHPQTSVISRYRVRSDDPDRVDPSSEEVLLRLDQPFGNHNGGSLEFGFDRKLYIGLGDGGKADDPFKNGQNLGTLLGSILRIDVDGRDEGLAYAIPADNPFVGVEGARGEIWAFGIRNPWRLSVDRLTGDIWIGDVGQNLWEEVDIIQKGGNHGWNLREGHHPFPPPADGVEGDAPEGFVAPILEYARQEGKSITGGVVYRGEMLPELYGTYLYGDFVTFNIWGLRYDGEKVTSNTLIARSSLPVTAFGESESGEVYIAALGAKEDVDIRKLSTGKVFNLQSGFLYKLVRRKAAEVDTLAFPRKLSETKLFADLVTMRPAPGLIPYEVNVPLWSDGAEKTRYLALPAAGQVVFRADGAWELPVGTVAVKTFGLDGDRERLETRLLVRSERGWDGYTYLWNEERTDARLLDSALLRETKTSGGAHDWYFPSRSDCNACHTQVAGHVLGVRTPQLHREVEYTLPDGKTRRANQIEILRDMGVFKNPEATRAKLVSYPDWGSAEHATASTRASLARAYLDVNCAVCHAPGGTGLAKADLRHATPLAAMSIVGQEPGRRIGPVGSQVVAPGKPERSELLLRMLSTGEGRMPVLGSRRVDWDAVRVVGEWIESLPVDAARAAPAPREGSF